LSASNSSNDILNLTAQIVAAHVSNNSVTSANLPNLIEQVFHALTTTDVKEPEPATLVPAVPIKRSVFPDHIVCLEDGEKFKMLRRHLATVHNMTPEQYRERWNLPSDYPIIAPNYSGQRSAMAKQFGLGRKPGKVVQTGVEQEDASSPDVPPVSTARPVGRPRKSTTD